MLLKKHGKQIDEHDVVMRLNNAPTIGFEPFIGALASPLSALTYAVACGHKNPMPNPTARLKRRHELARVVDKSQRLSEAKQ